MNVGEDGADKEGHVAHSGEDFSLCFARRSILSCFSFSFFSNDGSYYLGSSLIAILAGASPLALGEGVGLYVPFFLGASGD